MNYTIINSSSDRNCVIINEILAIDMGVSFKKIESFYQKLQLVFINDYHSNYLNKNTIKKLAKFRPILKFVVEEHLVSELLALGIPKNRIDVYNPSVEYNYRTFLKIKTFLLFRDGKNKGIKIVMNNKKFIYVAKINSIYEYMYQQQEKNFTKRFEMLKPILNKAREITLTEYELNDYGIYSCIEELIMAYKYKVEELKQLEQDIMDNYRPITNAEQYE